MDPFVSKFAEYYTCYIVNFVRVLWISYCHFDYNNMLVVILNNFFMFFLCTSHVFEDFFSIIDYKYTPYFF